MEDTPTFYSADITSGQSYWPTSCTQADDCRQSRRRQQRRQRSEHLLNSATSTVVCELNAPINTPNYTFSPFTSTTTSSSSFSPMIESSGPEEQCTSSEIKHPYEDTHPHHYHDNHSLKDTFSTSSKSPYLRPLPSISDLTKTSTTFKSFTSKSTTFKIPQFKMYHSLLLFSSLCLLHLLCNTVPLGKLAFSSAAHLSVLSKSATFFQIFPFR